MKQITLQYKSDFSGIKEALAALSVKREHWTFNTDEDQEGTALFNICNLQNKELAWFH